MELYITGDTHGDFSRFRPENFYEQEGLTKEDVVLVAGDFGGVWYGDSPGRCEAGLPGVPALHHRLCSRQP